MNCEALQWSKIHRALLPDLDSEFSQRPGFILQFTHQGVVGTLKRGVCTGRNELHPKWMIILVYYVYTSGQYGTFWNSLICVFSAGCVGRMVIVTSTIWVTLDHSVSICVLLGLPLSRSCEMRLWNQSPPKYCSDSKVGSDMLHFFLEAVLYCPFYQVCIRYHLCGLEIARYPTMHCTSASSLNGGKYFKVGTSTSSQVHMSAQCEWRNKRDCSYINCHYLSVGL